MKSVELMQRLESHPYRMRLIRHPYFSHLESEPLTRDAVATLLGQWWHPLHYFPTFLAQSIASSESVVVKTATSRILFQELGEGRPDRAHEEIYISTMSDAGFSVHDVTRAAPLPATSALVDGYAQASLSESGALGFIYATETADLAMVSAIGTSVRRVTGAGALPWVDIHVEQEPAHVEEAGHALSLDFSQSQASVLIEKACAMWTLWIAFFDSIYAASALPVGQTRPLAAKVG